MANVALLDADSIVQRIADYDTSSTDFLPEVDEHEAYYDYVSHVIIPTGLPVQLGDVYDIATETFLRDGNVVEIPPPLTSQTFTGMAADNIPSGSKVICLKEQDPTSLLVKSRFELTFPSGTHSDAKWSPDSRWLYLCCTGPDRLYDWQSGLPVVMPNSVLYNKTTNLSSTACAWSYDGRFLAVGYSGTPYMSIYDFSSGQPTLVSLSGISTYVSCLAWRPNNYILSVGFQGSTAVSLLAYDATGRTPFTIASTINQSASASQCSSIKWSHDGRYLAFCGSFTPKFKIIDANTTSNVELTLPSTIPTSMTYSVDWSSDNMLLVGVGNATRSTYIYSVSGTAVSYVASTNSQFPAVQYAQWWPDSGVVLLNYSSSLDICFILLQNGTISLINRIRSGDIGIYRSSISSIAISLQRKLICICAGLDFVMLEYNSPNQVVPTDSLGDVPMGWYNPDVLQGVAVYTGEDVLSGDEVTVSDLLT